MRESDLGTVITFNPSVIYATTSLAELLCQGVQSEFHHWPVVDDDMRLLGIVSEQDIARVVFELTNEFGNNLRVGAQQLYERTAGQIMTAPVVTISRWDTQISGLYFLLKNHIHSLPVIEDDHLIGLVTTTDYLREFSYGELPVSRHPVSDWVQNDIDPVDCEASLDEAAAVLSQAGVEQIGVVNGTLPLGVINSRDLRLAKCRLECHRLLGDKMSSPGPTTMRELAAKSPVIRPGARLSEAADLMVQHHRQAIAVVTQAGRLVGVLSEEILLSAMAGQKPMPAMAQ